MECSCGKMIEQAKEELQALETRYPCRFGHLKEEVKSFILLVESQHLLLHDHHHHISSPPSSSFSVSTQESTCRKRKKRGAQETVVGIRTSPPPEKKNRVDAVLDRAKSCLQKIQDLKDSL